MHWFPFTPNTIWLLPTVCVRMISPRRNVFPHFRKKFAAQFLSVPWCFSALVLTLLFIKSGQVFVNARANAVARHLRLEKHRTDCGNLCVRLKRRCWKSSTDITMYINRRILIRDLLQWSSRTVKVGFLLSPHVILISCVVCAQLMKTCNQVIKSFVFISAIASKTT